MQPRPFHCLALISSVRRTAICSHRTFFTLPDLSSLSPFSEPNGNLETQTYHERKILPYKRSELYHIVADVRSYPRFVPFCRDARVISMSTQAESTGPLSPVIMDAELTVGFLSFRESYVSKVTCKPCELVEAVASSSTPLFKTLTTTWRFQPASPQSPHSTTGSLRRPEPPDPQDGGPTLVTLDLAYAFANPVHATVSAAFFGQVSKLMVRAFEERCMEVYGPGNE